VNTLLWLKLCQVSLITVCIAAACSSAHNPLTPTSIVETVATATVTKPNTPLPAVATSSPLPTTTQSILATFKIESQISAFQSLPSGTYIVYSWPITRDQKTVITYGAVSPDGSIQQPLFDNNFIGVFSPDRQYMAFVINDIDRSRMFVVDLIRGTLTELPDTDSCYYPTWSPDGSELAIICNDYEIYAFSLSQNTLSMLLSDPEKQPTISHYAELRWSPDGKWLAYLRLKSTGPEDRFSLYALDLSCRTKPETCVSRTRQILTFPNYAPFDWTSDNYLAIANNESEGGREINVIDVSNGNLLPNRTLYGDLRFNEISSLAWSPDGKWVAITQYDGSGILLLSTDGEKPIHLDVAGSVVASWIVRP
jgi:Tol biopolymer transport system component